MWRSGLNDGISHSERGSGGKGSSVEPCCLELLQGGFLLLLQGGCLELLSCAPASCCFLLENDTDGSAVILLEDGDGCLAPEDCP
jgi:hypothetical protein